MRPTSEWVGDKVRPQVRLRRIPHSTPAVADDPWLVADCLLVTGEPVFTALHRTTGHNCVKTVKTAQT